MGIQHTSITQSGLKMLPTKSLLPIILVLLPCCLSVPRFLNSKDQVRKCFSGFIRCCSSTKKIDSNSQTKMMMMEDIVENIMEEVMVEKIQEMDDVGVDTRSSYFPKK